MTLLDPAPAPQHLTLHGVSWSYYEHTLEQIGDRPIRVAYLDGSIEIMSPLPKHEQIKRAIGRLIEELSVGLGIPTASLGSATFRAEDLSAGAEPDECYYFREIASVKPMERFNPLVHRPPDLVVEVDVWSPSIPREPIYARLRVPEIWRYSSSQFRIRELQDGVYIDVATSRAFPTLPVAAFVPFVRRMVDEDETQVVREFREWVQSLK
jgi:Uma2 family endonuclease